TEPRCRLLIVNESQFAGRCGANATSPATALVSRPNSPSSSGLTIIAADQVCCGVLVGRGSYWSRLSTSVPCPGAPCDASKALEPRLGQVASCRYRRESAQSAQRVN